MVGDVVGAFVFAGEDAGDDFKVGVVVVGEREFAEVLAGELAVEGGVGDALGGEEVEAVIEPWPACARRTATTNSTPRSCPPYAKLPWWCATGISPPRCR
ncbi:hypothetical protein [Actinokineospora cianjurensis]|uniref:hypothetical protein n=1 Tax=Actinokineospora cianjurensis TaxID=585224 RepID=UPI0014772B7F|nr:hypothetical protein [Actinokineospora cianjurensis]